MRRFLGGLIGSTLLAAAIFFVVVPAALSAPGDNGTACENHPDNGVPPFCVVLPPPPPPPGGAGNGIFGVGAVSGDLPRGLWCNTLGILSLSNPDGGVILISPLNAVNLYVFQGKALEAAGLVSAADWASGVGAFCPGAPQVAGKTVTLVGTKVNNLGQSIPGDPGAIYNLATVS